MKFYIAAPWPQMVRAATAADDLERAGFEVVSTWHRRTPENLKASGGMNPTISDSEAMDEVISIIGEVQSCDVLISLVPNRSDPEFHTGGRHIETGIAIALHKRVVVVGRPENVFHRALRQVDDWNAAMRRVQMWAAVR
jgi:nucleoside 2-deoxyribosyltransferase